MLPAVCPEGVRIYNSNLDIWCKQHSFTLHLRDRWIHTFYALFYSRRSHHKQPNGVQILHENQHSHSLPLESISNWKWIQYIFRELHCAFFIWQATIKTYIHTHITQMLWLNTDIPCELRFFCINLRTVRVVYSNCN